MRYTDVGFFSLLLVPDTDVQHLVRIPTFSSWFSVSWHIPTSAFFHSYQIRMYNTCNNLSLLEGLEFTPPSSARTKGDDSRYYVYTFLVGISTFSSYFPFDEIYRRLLLFTLTRYGCATPGTYTNVFFLIFRLMTSTGVCFFSLLPDTYVQHLPLYY